NSTWDSTKTRLYALQQAMKNFYDTVSASVSGSNARIRYAFVPYSSAVNVGKLLYDLNPGYLSNSVTVPSRQAVDASGNPVTTAGAHFDHWVYKNITFDATNYNRFVTAYPLVDQTRTNTRKYICTDYDWRGNCRDYDWVNVATYYTKS